MIKAVLLDLDDTLLNIDTDEFIRAYVVGITRHLLKRFPDLAHSEIPIPKAIERAVRAAAMNTDPNCTVTQIIVDVWTNSLNLAPEDFAAAFAEFVPDGFNAFRHLATPVEGALAFVNQLSALGLTAVIATNPIFPLDVAKLRLEWAGLSLPEVPFAFISNSDDLHFCKPASHFYEELLARIGVEADEALMVGDSLNQDMIPASQAGLNVFWIEHPERPPSTRFSDDLHLDGRGSLADLATLVAEGWLTTLTPRSHTVAQIETRMIGNVGALKGLIGLIQPEFWLMRPDPNEWSPLEILCHLRDSESGVQRARLERIAHETNPFVSQPQTPVGPGERDLSGEDGQAVFAEFWQQRGETLAFLRSLQPEDWSRPAQHSIFGPTTLLEMAHFTTRHDHLHINQLCETIGRCKQAVRTI